MYFSLVLCFFRCEGRFQIVANARVRATRESSKTLICLIVDNLLLDSGSLFLALRARRYDLIDADTNINSGVIHSLTMGVSHSITFPSITVEFLPHGGGTQAKKHAIFTANESFKIEKDMFENDPPVSADVSLNKDDQIVFIADGTFKVNGGDTEYALKAAEAEGLKKKFTRVFPSRPVFIFL